jgi:hypothetical protein
MTAQNITLGPKPGFNIDSWSSTFDHISSRIALHFGGFGELEINDNTDKVSAGLRFQIGINDLLTEDEDKLRNQVIQLYAAFPLVRTDQ